MTPVRRRVARAGLDVMVLWFLPAVAVGAVYLRLYVSKRYAFPVGYDTPKYLWRSSLVGAKGLAALSGAAPVPFRSNPDRPGFPLLVDTIRTVLGVSPTSLVIVLPATMASVVGLGAGALARLGLLAERWTMPVFVLAVGASANVSRMAGPGYLDNLVLTAIAMTAAAMALRAASVEARGRSGWWPVGGAAMLLTAGLLTHWIFAVVLAAVLITVAALSVPASIRARRTGGGALATPTGRLLSILGASAVAGGAGLAALGSEPSPPRLPRRSFVAKLEQDVPRYTLWVTGVLAAVGAVLGFAPAAGPAEGPDREARDDARRGTWLVVVWAATGAAGVALLAVGASVPAHRFLAFAMGIPLLVAMALAAVGRIAGRPGGVPTRVAAVAVVVAGLAATSVIAERAWSGTHPWISANQAIQAGVAGDYLQRVGGDAPVVFVVDLGGASPLPSTSEAFHVIRTQLPAEAIPRTLVYLGTADDLLAGKPTLRPAPFTFDQASLQHWPSVRAVLDRGPIVLSMPAFDRGFAASVASHPERAVAPTLAVIQGPRPPGTYGPVAVPTPLPPVRLALLWTAFLGVLTVIGLGWAAAFVQAGAVERFAAAPAFGISAVVLVGLVADRVGVHPSGAAAVAVALIATALGGVLAAIRLRGGVSPGPS